MYIVVTQKGVC